jgi:3-hydroxybutyryl-CoA dehydrogenase/5-formyl-3-hydroxy-2-methylpyridine 4-carboxylate dehydrogenase
MKAAVIGLGTMGPGMAATLANGGMDVACFDIVPAQLERARGEVAGALQVLERIAGRAPSAGRIDFTGELAAALQGADLVLESVPEKLEIKQRVFAELDRLAPAAALLASNTSGIPITELQQATQRKERVLGMHWSNPPTVIPMIEVIAGAHTAPAAIERMAQLIRGLGLIPVLVQKDVPGFVENRVLYAILRECCALVERGVISAADLDTCVKWGIGFKLAVIGPMELLDVAGLDIYEAVGSYLNADLDDSKSIAAMITERTRAGRLGMKTGRGIYEYTPERIAELRARRAAKLVAVRKILEER